jgi:CubicO group peptidase (beta-lactamase class C family)
MRALLRNILLLLALSSLLLPIAACSAASLEVTPTTGLEGFEAGVDKIRVALKIPGMSACMVKDKEIVWARGFGCADIEEQIPATEDTSFHIASLTKTFAAIITMQLVQEGQLELQTPVSEFDIELDDVCVVHLLSHTSEGDPPGIAYKYNGDRFALMDRVIESVSGETFAALLVERIIKPLKLFQTAPSMADSSAFAETGYNQNDFLDNMATPYESYGIGTVRQTEYRTYFGTAAGLVSSACDLGKYAIAIDQEEFLQSQTWETIFTPATSVATGKMLPYGIGWFIQSYKDNKLHWHYGQWRGCAALIIRAPGKGITFIALANNETLSSAYPMGKGDVTKSDLARLFLDYYVIGDEALP